ncbi:peptidase dimerization domain-containing protein [Actinomadura parmotrematis]|uniref:Peptidase dimerization domain-containing protein n=1 Tax=Actinomadura parmotrematis TaxID=2864039 RepID=A0ABS7G1W8_9ACTN|nr:peptidase dimerization domain-containing protein [Actinomadura parmotrematis]MBW8485874.1 peptidase dimerization domain-containing protein [Actinomadura parmotrematis]
MSWTEAARARIDRARLRELVCGLVAIPSPTGDEAPLARHAAAELAAAGLRAGTLDMDDRQASAWARLPGAGHGPDLLLYAPVDTLTAGRADADVPWIGPELRPDTRPEPAVHGDLVTGLGAGNPKGHAACVIAAAEAIAAAGVPLAGDLLVGLGAGGMPTNALALDGDPRRHTGQGAGCSFLLEQGLWADHAVIAKPGWTVSHEEVGLAWFEVTVHGTHTYVGSRHRLPYRNAIVDAGRVAAALDGWFAEFADRHTAGTVAPQGVVAAIEGGWMRMAAVTPAACRLRCDLRLPPDLSPMQAKREFAQAIDAIAKETGADLDWDMVLAIPGTRTDPADPVVTATVAAWEEAAGAAFAPVTGNSGATDANILRARGVPTVRVGMPKVRTDALTPDPSADFQMGMNTVDLTEMERLTRLLVRVAVDVIGVTDAR